MRVHTVQKARAAKKPRSCRRCGHKIEAGETYRWAEPRYGPLLIWCHEHYPRRSELSSSKLGQVWDAQDEFDVSEVTDIDEIKTAVEAVGEIARDVASEYEDSISNMPEGLQEGQVAEEMREKIDALEAYADELESWDPDEVEEFDEETVTEEVSSEVILEIVDEMEEQPDEDVTEEWILEHGDADDYRSRIVTRLQERRDAWDQENGDAAIEAVREQAVEVVGNFDY